MNNPFSGLGHMKENVCISLVGVSFKDLQMLQMCILWEREKDIMRVLLHVFPPILNITD